MNGFLAPHPPLVSFFWWHTCRSSPLLSFSPPVSFSSAHPNAAPSSSGDTSVTFLGCQSLLPHFPFAFDLSQEFPDSAKLASRTYSFSCMLRLTVLGFWKHIFGIICPSGHPVAFCLLIPKQPNMSWFFKNPKINKKKKIVICIRTNNFRSFLKLKLNSRLFSILLGALRILLELCYSLRHCMITNKVTVTTWDHAIASYTNCTFKKAVFITVTHFISL